MASVLVCGKPKIIYLLFGPDKVQTDNRRSQHIRSTIDNRIKHMSDPSYTNLAMAFNSATYSDYEKPEHDTPPQPPPSPPCHSLKLIEPGGTYVYDQVKVTISHFPDEVLTCVMIHMDNKTRLSGKHRLASGPNSTYTD
jgi:hypothetical protein